MFTLHRRHRTMFSDWTTGGIVGYYYLTRETIPFSQLVLMMMMAFDSIPTLKNGLVRWFQFRFSPFQRLEMKIPWNYRFFSPSQSLNQAYAVTSRLFLMETGTCNMLTREIITQHWATLTELPGGHYSYQRITFSQLGVPMGCLCNY